VGFFVVLLALVVMAMVGAVVVAGVIALRNKSSFERDSRLAPGLSTSAPAAWAGSHDPEARLHRRLRDAIAALSANQAFDDDGNLIDLRVELEHQAVALDEQLVATAALPLHVRREPLERITGGVVAIEQAVADLAGASASEAAARLSRVLDDVRTRTGLVAQARAALDALDSGPGATAPPTPGVASPAPEQPSSPPLPPDRPQTPPPQQQPGS